MKLSKYFFVILIISSTAFAQPKLSLDKLEINLGVIYSGMEAHGKISLKNIGNDTLRIFSIQPSCGCTAVKKPKEFLLPNESDELEAEFNSIGYHGKVTKHINITTNDITNQNVSVPLVVEVKDELRSTNLSSLLWLGDIEIGKSSVQKVSFVNVADHKIKIKGARASVPYMTLQLEKNNLRPNDTLNVQITIKPEKPGYYRDDFIIIDTDSKNLPSIEAKVQYRCFEAKSK